MGILNNGRIGIDTVSHLTKFGIKNSYSDENSGLNIDASDGNAVRVTMPATDWGFG